VLAVSATCEYCRKSAPFYRQLSERISSSADVRLLVVSPEPEAAVENWLSSIGVVGYRLVRERVGRYGFRVTPTLVIVDQHGRITDLLIGQLSREEEEAVLSRLDDSSPTPDIR